MIKKFSNAGGYHHFDNSNNQDAISTASDRRYIAISLADGVSSCSQAKAGAQIACEALNRLLKNRASFFFRFEPRQIAEVVISHILFELKKQAEKDNIAIEEYSSTISSVLIDTKLKKALIIHLGDGIIMGTTDSSVKVLAPPGDSRFGCCVTTTKNAVKSVRVETISTDGLDSITICSDGAWRELFNRNRIKTEATSCLVNNDYDQLTEFLTHQNCFDDYSYVSIDFEKKNRRKPA